MNPHIFTLTQLGAAPASDWGPALEENRTGRYAPQPTGKLPAEVDGVILPNEDYQTVTFRNKCFDDKES